MSPELKDLYRTFNKNPSASDAYLVSIAWARFSYTYSLEAISNALAEYRSVSQNTHETN